MKNLKTIESKVKAILQKNEEARNDDMTLYLIVCNTCLKDAGAMSFAEVIGQFTRNYTQTTKRGLLTTNKG